MQGLALPFGLKVVVVDLLLFERELRVHFPGKELLVEHPDQQEEQKDGTGGANVHSHKVAAAVEVLSNFVGLFCSHPQLLNIPRRGQFSTMLATLTATAVVSTHSASHRHRPLSPHTPESAPETNPLKASQRLKITLDRLLIMPYL